MQGANPKNKGLIVAIVGFFITLGVFVFMYFDLQKVYTQVFDIRSQVGVIREDKARERTILELMSRTEVDRTTVEGYFVGADGVVDFIEEVEALGERIGAEVEVESVRTVELTETNKVEGLEKLELVASMTGSWSDTMSFLTKIENFPYKIHINKLLVEKSGDGEGGWRSEYGISVLKSK